MYESVVVMMMNSKKEEGEEEEEVRKQKIKSEKVGGEYSTVLLMIHNR